MVVGRQDPDLGHCRWAGPAEPRVTSLSCLLHGLRGVPADVTDVLFLDRSALASTAYGDVPRMASFLTAEVAAVVCGAPVTDAVKRIHGDRLLSSVDREGLLTLQTPHVLRRDALREALLVLPAGGPTDPAGLFLAAGQSVRLFHALSPHGCTTLRVPRSDQG